MKFMVIVVSGLMAFTLPFSIITTGLHSLMGFVFIALIALHITNNIKGFKKSFKSRRFLFSFIFVSSITTLFIWQPKPIQKILSLSNNLGAAQDLFEMKENGMTYHYTPTENYKLKLEVRAGENYSKGETPEIAIWLENKSSYHIKTLHNSNAKSLLPYWAWKVKEYEKAKKEKKDNSEEVDSITSATPNSSFDPKDYILPERNKEPFFLLIEINQAGDSNEHYKDQPSLIYKVEIDNKNPRIFQVMDLVGYSKYDEEEKEWSAYYADETITSAVKLIDSALLTIDR